MRSIAIGAAVALAGAAAAEECPPDAAAVTSLGRIVHESIAVHPGTLRQIGPAEPEEAVRYMRLLVRPRVEGGGTWRLHMRDPQLRIIDTVTSEDVVPGAGFWTRRLYSEGKVRLDLSASSPKTTVDVVRVIVMPEKTKNPYYSVQVKGRQAYQDLYEAPTSMRRAGDHVGFVMAGWHTRSWCCSGVAVGDDLFLTNWHCGGDRRAMPAAQFWSAEVCEATFIDFSWDGDKVDREYTCSGVLDKDEANDYALLRIRPLRGTDRVGAAKLRVAPPASGEPLRIIHHPECRPKQVTFGCSVETASIAGWHVDAKSDFSYPCDTEAGSSGGAVFDEQNRLIGIHHLGFQKRDGRCDRLNKGVGLEGILGAMKPDNAARLRALMEE